MSYRTNLLMDLFTEIKVAQNNKIRDVKIDETLKNKLRKNLHLLPYTFIFSSYLLLVLSCLFIIDEIPYFIVFLLYFCYIFEHPFTNILKLYIQGATFNQIFVMYDRVFSHIIKMRYVLIPSILFTLLYYYYDINLVPDFNSLHNLLDSYYFNLQENDIRLIHGPMFQIYASDIIYPIVKSIHWFINSINNCMMYCTYMAFYLFFVTKVIQFFKVPR